MRRFVLSPKQKSKLDGYDLSTDVKKDVVKLWEARDRNKEALLPFDLLLNLLVVRFTALVMPPLILLVLFLQYLFF